MTGRVPTEPGSREPSPAVSAASGFDPSREFPELDEAYAVVGEILEYFDSHRLAAWAPVAEIILRERRKGWQAARDVAVNHSNYGHIEGNKRAFAIAHDIERRGGLV